MTESILKRLAECGGSIVDSGELSPEELLEALNDERTYLVEDNLFVYCYPVKHWTKKIGLAITQYNDKIITGEISSKKEKFFSISCVISYKQIMFTKYIVAKTKKTITEKLVYTIIQDEAVKLISSNVENFDPKLIGMTINTITNLSKKQYDDWYSERFNIQNDIDDETV